jgi:ABC-type Fe3+-hydroxamate transport system substrate-binding protein
MKLLAISLLALLAGCSSATPSATSLSTSLEQVVGALSATRTYAQASENGNPFGLYVCEATVTLALTGTNTTNGGLAVKAVTMGASSANTTSNTVQIKLDAPACEGKSAPAGTVPLMLKAPH